jgi:hypothetical protein
VGGKHDAVGAGALGATDDRAEIARVGHRIEHGEQRRGSGRDFVGVGIAVRLHSGDHALVIGRGHEGCEPALRFHVDPNSAFRQPRLSLQRPLGREDLEHLARPPQRLTHGPAPVEVLRGHRFGTSW